MDKQLCETAGLTEADMLQHQGTKAHYPPHPGKLKLNTEQLFGAAREVIIVHKGEQYRLCITRNEKLILTK